VVLHLHRVSILLPLPNNLLIPGQSGFRPHHSTQSSLIRLVDQLQQKIDKGETNAAVFIDTSKAFDSVSHQRLILKLKNLGVEGSELQWFTSYLTGRQQIVRVGKSLSPPLYIKTGVPQGSILGPLLFLVYINDLPDIFTSASVNLYADDTVIYAAGKSEKQLESVINEEMAKLTEWFQRNQLQLNQKKTVLMLFGTKANVDRMRNLKITVGSEQIGTSESTKYLGVTLDSCLGFDSHIEKTCSSAGRALGMISRVKRQMPTACRKALVDSLVLPHLDYCDVVWSTGSTAALNRLQSIQNRSAKIILGVKNRVSSEWALGQLKWDQLDRRREIHLAEEIYKAEKKLSPLYMTEMLTSSHKTHGYATRGNFTRVRMETSVGLKSFSYRAGRFASELSALLEKSSSIASFRTGLKEIFIQRQRV